MVVEKVYRPCDGATQTSIPQRQPQSNPEKQTVKRKVVVQLARFKEVLYIALITVITLISVYMLSLKMDTCDTQGKIADLDQKIEKQFSEDSALKSEIKKNSSYERTYDKAKKQGMNLESDNVKVVCNNGEAKN